MSDELNVLKTHSLARGTTLMQARLRDGRPQCQGSVYRKLGRFGEWGQCERAGVVMAEAGDREVGREVGKLYYFCRQHSPEGKAKREEGARKRREEEVAANRRKWARQSATRDILAALKANDIEAARAAYRIYAENDE